jgi:MHS family proline/betaine transporter-like MFS transporter
MGIFSTLQREQRQAIGLLSIGTFLEYFDLFLYIHMAVLLNDLFFPKTDTHTQALLSAFAFSSAFVFRPIGALVFGYIGDTYGRKATIMLTTFIMATTCLIMANAPTYAQVGVAAAWLVTLCRALQGIASMGEIVGAQLFLTEAIPLPSKYPAVGLIYIFADLGATTALGIATLATAHGFNWRLAFWVGAGVAIIGSAARTTLRESPEFADAKRRIKNIAERVNENASFLEKSPFYNQKVNKKTALAYFLIQCSSPVFFYFTFIYGAQILKNNFSYKAHEIIYYNFILAIFQLFAWSILRTYLSTKIYPLKILKIALIGSSIIVPVLPLFLNNLQAPWQLFLLQALIITFLANDMPALPILFKYFPVFKRFTYASLLVALSRVLVYIVSSFGLTYLIEYFGYWGLLVVMLPALIGYGYGLNHFKQLEIAAGRYPDKNTQPELGVEIVS